ncbi:MAG: hypothetical protein ACP5GO_04955 [Thermoprotei archaeon]
MDSERTTILRYGIVLLATIIIYGFIRLFENGEVAQLTLSVLFLPTWTFVVLVIFGSLIRLRSGNDRGRALNDAFWEFGFAISFVLAPSLTAYLLMRSALAYLAAFAQLSASQARGAAGAFAGMFITIAGAIVHRAAPKRPEQGLGAALYRKFAFPVIFYGLASFIGSFNSSAAVPFLIDSLVALALFLAFLGLALTARFGLSRSWEALEDMEKYYGKALGVFFIVGVLYSVLMAGENSLYWQAAWVILICFALLTGFALSFRAYSMMANIAENQVEKIYKQHEVDHREYLTTQDEAYVKMVRDFLRFGRKEELLVFAASRLSACGMGYSEIVGALEPLMDYSGSTREALWPWEVRSAARSAKAEIEKRKDIVNKVMELVNGCGKKET